MMNPLMGGQMGNVMRVMQQYNQLRQNPNGIADFLKQQGKVTDEQYSQMRGMNPMQIGQYLMQNGGITQQTVQDAQSMMRQ